MCAQGDRHRVTRRVWGLSRVSHLGCRRDAGAPMVGGAACGRSRRTDRDSAPQEGAAASAAPPTWEEIPVFRVGESLPGAESERYSPPWAPGDEAAQSGARGARLAAPQQGRAARRTRDPWHVAGFSSRPSAWAQVPRPLRRTLASKRHFVLRADTVGEREWCDPEEQRPTAREGR